jgi:hypothetical protein
MAYSKFKSVILQKEEAEIECDCTKYYSAKSLYRLYGGPGQKYGDYRATV